MKNKLKGKMVKTDRPKVDMSEVVCECLSCKWTGNIEDTKTVNYKDLLCPVCSDRVVIYEL